MFFIKEKNDKIVSRNFYSQRKVLKSQNILYFTLKKSKLYFFFTLKVCKKDYLRNIRKLLVDRRRDKNYCSDLNNECYATIQNKMLMGKIKIDREERSNKEELQIKN